jgi:phthalate 4,5-dioxygenase
MGPHERMPAPPDFEWMRAPASHRFVTKTFEDCNYLQAMEGGLDTSHSSFTHNNHLGSNKALRNIDTAPRTDVEPTDYGYRYISTRHVGADRRYVRVYHYVMPNQQMRGTFTPLLTEGNGDHPYATPKSDGHFWVPIDDERTMVYNWACGRDASVPLSPEFRLRWECLLGRGPDDLVPGTHKLKRNLSNDYLIDRKIQKTKTFTGITGINTQDWALQEGMGPIADRSKEHLGPSDIAIVTLRRLMLEAIRAVERGATPPGVNPQSHRDIRPYDAVITGNTPWQEAFASELVAKW